MSVPPNAPLSVIDVTAVLITLAAVLGYVNHRFIRLPSTIGLMVTALLASLVVVAASALFPALHLQQTVAAFVGEIDFNRALMEGMLSVLLFAGALHVNLDDLMERRWAIGGLASFGVLISTFAVAGMMFLVLGLLGLPVPFLICLLFGALISPTDPIAVLGILKTAGASKGLTAKITGESLFNDGVGVVVFTALVGIAFGGGHGSDGIGIAVLFVQEVAGGALIGLIGGYVTYLALRSVDQYALEVLMTLSLVLGSYALASAVHASGPIAVVVAGLLIGNHGMRLGMSEKTAEHVTTFWTLNDEILNAVLFLLIGLEVFAVQFTGAYLAAGLIAIPVCLAARLVSVAVPLSLLGLKRQYTKGAIPILTWAGLKGGISVALALSLPPFAHRELIITCTYIVVLFSIIVQGLTVGRVIARLKQDEAA